MYGTNIKKGVILMVSRDVKFKEFVIEGARFEMYCDLWTQRLEEYYSKFGWYQNKLEYCKKFLEQ